MNKALAGLVLLVGTNGMAAGARAGGLDLALSNTTANLSVLINPRQLEGGGSELALGAFVSEGDDRLLHASLMARGNRRSADSQYEIAAGVKAIGGDIGVDPERVPEGGEDTVRVGAVALGFQVTLVTPSRYNPIELGVGAFFAPGITSFSDAEQFSEYTARLQIEIIPQASAYVGYRRMGFDTKDYPDVNVDEGVHVGLKIVY